MKVEDPKGKSVEENMRPTDRLNKGPSICNIKREQVLAKDISFLSFNGVNSLMFCFFFTKSITWGKGEWRVSLVPSGEKGYAIRILLERCLSEGNKSNSHQYI